MNGDNDAKLAIPLTRRQDDNGRGDRYCLLIYEKHIGFKIFGLRTAIFEALVANQCGLSIQDIEHNCGYSYSTVRVAVRRLVRPIGKIL